MTDPIRLYPWCLTPEEQAEDDRNLELIRALTKSLRNGDLIDFENDRVIRADPPSIRSIDGELEVLGLSV